jgi:hypothetical protein
MSKNKINGLTLTRRLIGDRSEKDFMSSVPCPSCNKIQYYQNLNSDNYNYPGVDIRCQKCDIYIQLKSGKKYPKLLIDIDCYPIQCSTRHITLQCFRYYSNRFYYAYLQYDSITGLPIYAIISQLLSINDLHKSKNYILCKANDSTYYNFNHNLRYIKRITSKKDRYDKNNIIEVNDNESN